MCLPQFLSSDLPTQAVPHGILTPPILCICLAIWGHSGEPRALSWWGQGHPGDKGRDMAQHQALRPGKWK